MTAAEVAALITVCAALVAGYIVIGRKRWGLVREGWCKGITYHDWARFRGVCSHTFDDTYSDETDTDFHFNDGVFTLGCTVVKYDVALPTRIRLEVNWLGAYRIVAVDEIKKAA